MVGALIYTWSDTFWFSAVEGEVYAFSSAITAVVFWLILKWEDHADEPRSDRWLVLIAYMTGLSVGVHLLNLLCLPAIVLIYYYKKVPGANAKGSLLALLGSAVLVAVVLCGILEGAFQGIGGKASPFLPMVGALSVTLLTAGSLDSLMGLGASTMKTCRCSHGRCCPRWPPPRRPAAASRPPRSSR